MKKFGVIKSMSETLGDSNTQQTIRKELSINDNSHDNDVVDLDIWMK